MISPTTKSRIEAQGFLGLDEKTMARIDYWLRVAPLLCLVWTAVGTARESAALLWALVPFALLGALLPSHPFDILYNFGMRHLTGGPRLPRYGLPRRFACLLATAILVGAALSFQFGNRVLGHVFGWFLVSAALVNVTTGFCIPSFLYGLLFGRPASCGVSSRPE